MDQALHGSRRGAGIEGNHQCAAVGAAAQRTDGDTPPGDGGSAQADLPNGGALILHRQHVLTADAVAGERNGHVTAVKIRGVAVG